MSGTWATADDVLTPNANGFDAAGHVFVTSAPADAANGAIATGFAGESHGNVHLPDAGSTAMLLASVLAGLGLPVVSSSDKERYTAFALPSVK
jgi:hypothetical protein